MDQEGIIESAYDPADVRNESIIVLKIQLVKTEIHPRFFHFDVRLINFPGVIAGFEVRTAAFFEFWCIALNPAVDGRMIHREAPLQHDALQGRDSSKHTADTIACTRE